MHILIQRRNELVLQAMLPYIEERFPDQSWYVESAPKTSLYQEYRIVSKKAPSDFMLGYAEALALIVVIK